MPGFMSDHDLAQAGFIPGTPGEVIGPFDKPDRYVVNDDQPEDIWEDKDGIRTVYRPEILLYSEPLLWGPYTDFCVGRREVSRKDLKRESNIWVEANLVLQGAMSRRLIPKKDVDGGG